MKKFQTLTFVLFAFIAGLVIRGYLSQADMKLPPGAGCNQIARWHADYLIREYRVDFNTNPENPKKELNQKASELNSMLLAICNTNPNPTE